MEILLLFLFRLPLPYRLLGLPGALILKHRIRRGLQATGLLVLLIFALVTRGLGAPAILAGAWLLARYDTTRDGLVSKLHESRVFGGWRSTMFVTRSFLYGMILLNFC